VEEHLMKPINRAPMSCREPQHQNSAGDLLQLLYFIHDKGISALAATMRGRLTQTQASILWLIHSEGGGARNMPRKEIARRLHDWFDLGNPAITSALQLLAQPPLSLLRLIDSAESGREKSVFLTAKGQRFVASMAARGQTLMQELLSDLAMTLPDDQIIAGIEFLRLAVAFFQRINPRPRWKEKNPGNGNKLKLIYTPERQRRALAGR
jgi:DNA-binding MarR family transcriptional regulator